LRNLKLCPSFAARFCISVREVYRVLTLDCDATLLGAHSTVNKWGVWEPSNFVLHLRRDSVFPSVRFTAYWP